MSQIALTNVITISVSAASAGVGQYNTSNLAIFTTEVPGNSFGTLGYALYVDPTSVGTDFGTNSKVYAMANAIFSQQPNILVGGGQLVIIKVAPAHQTLTFSGVAASGHFVLGYGGNNTSQLAYTATAADIQAALNLLPGLADVTVTGSIASESLVIVMAGVYGATPALLTVSSNTLQTGGSVAITVTPTISTNGTSLGTAITNSVGLVQYFGILSDSTITDIGDTDLLAAAAVIQGLNKIGFFVSYDPNDVLPGGEIDKLRTGSYTQSRGLFYDDNTVVNVVKGWNAIMMAASYAGRALSVNFTGSNTTQTMHLKVLTGVQPDPNITQTILTNAITAGADTYVSMQGTPVVFTSGANKYFDQVYNLQWFVGALQVAGFNFLAQSSTKIPQTESGMDGLKGAYRQVCQQAVSNQYVAPGSWNSGSTFGNLTDFVNNIAQVGYYIYSSPIATQSQADRQARKAPLVQIAVKEAGAIQESTVIVNVTA